MRWAPSARAFTGSPSRLPASSRLMRSASPLVIHTTLTRPPAAITRWITPAQHSVSSSGCGDTTRSEVRASRAGSASVSGAGGAALAPTGTNASSATRSRSHRMALVSHAARFSLQCANGGPPVRTPLLAYHDPQFIDSDEGRPIRIVSEYLAPLRPGGSRSLGERLLVCSGGGPGIMEAANRGAALAGGRSIGLNISLPQEQRPNPYVTPELCFEFHYFFMRKLWFAHLAHALIAFPGGFGTLDELFEILTLAQTRKLDRSIPVLLYGSAYWREGINFEARARHGTIAPEDLQLFEFVDEPHAAFERLRARISLPPAPQPAFAKSRCNPNA